MGQPIDSGTTDFSAITTLNVEGHRTLPVVQDPCAGKMASSIGAAAVNELNASSTLIIDVHEAEAPEWRYTIHDT